MTCVVAVLDRDKCVMGGDSCATAENNYIISSTKKIFKKQEMLIGVAESFRIINLISIFNPPLNTQSDNYTYLIKTFMPAFKKMLDKNEVSSDFQMLIGFSNQIFEIDSEFSIIEHSNYAAIGSGCIAALASLYTSQNMTLSSNDRVLIALQSAQAFINSVKEPFGLLEI